MTRFVVGDDRSQSTLFPERLDDYLGEDNPVRAIDVFVDELDLAKLGFGGVEPEVTGRPAYHPATLLKIYVYGYLNRVQSSRRLERECQRNIERDVLAEMVLDEIAGAPHLPRCESTACCMRQRRAPLLETQELEQQQSCERLGVEPTGRSRVLDQP
jgi:transposase